MKRFLVLCSVGLVTLGCDHDKAPDAASVATPPAASVAPAVPTASVAAADTAAPAPLAPDVVAKIPAEEDFEAQAAAAITAANASQQLSLIEKEIAK